MSGSIAAATSPPGAPTAPCTSTAAPTSRSRFAASASSPAKSKPRSCATRPSRRPLSSPGPINPAICVSSRISCRVPSRQSIVGQFDRRSSISYQMRSCRPPSSSSTPCRSPAMASSIATPSPPRARPRSAATTSPRHARRRSALYAGRRTARRAPRWPQRSFLSSRRRQHQRNPPGEPRSRSRPAHDAQGHLSPPSPRRLAACHPERVERPCFIRLRRGRGSAAGDANHLPAPDSRRLMDTIQPGSAVTGTDAPGRVGAGCRAAGPPRSSRRPSHAGHIGPRPRNSAARNCERSLLPPASLADRDDRGRTLRRHYAPPTRPPSPASNLRPARCCRPSGRRRRRMNPDACSW